MKKHWTAQEDALLRALQGRGVKGRAIGQLLGRSKQAVHARASLLRRGTMRQPWSATEDALIRDTASYRTAASIGAELKRTAAAVNSRASTLGICWLAQSQGQQHRGFTATGVAKLLGVGCSKTVVDWIEKGYLESTRRAARFVGRQRQAYRIMPDALRAFLRDYPWLYQRKNIVDRGWAAFVATLPREEWIGTVKAAQLLYLTEAGVALAIRKGDLQAEKQGANWLIPLSAIRAYIPPPLGGVGLSPDVAQRRTRTLAARKTRSYTQRPETVAAAVASRAARRLQQAA